jgi:hypothetical protein
MTMASITARFFVTQHKRWVVSVEQTTFPDRDCNHLDCQVVSPDLPRILP